MISLAAGLAILDEIFEDSEIEFWDGRPGEGVMLAPATPVEWYVNANATAQNDETITLEHLPGPGSVSWLRVLKAGETWADVALDEHKSFRDNGSVHYDAGDLSIRLRGDILIG